MRKKCLSLFMAVNLVLVFLGVGCTSTAAPNPEDTVVHFWAAMVEGNYEKAANYVVGDENVLALFPEFWEEDSEMFGEDELSLALLERIQVSPTGHEVVGEEAMVSLEVTWPDLGEFLTTFLQEAMASILSMAFEGVPEAEIEEALSTMFMSILEETPIITTNHQVTLVLEEGQWKLIEPPIPNPEAVFELPDF